MSASEVCGTTLFPGKKGAIRFDAYIFGWTEYRPFPSRSNTLSSKNKKHMIRVNPRIATVHQNMTG